MTKHNSTHGVGGRIDCGTAGSYDALEGDPNWTHRGAGRAAVDAARICEQQAERWTDDRARYAAHECAAAIRAAGVGGTPTTFDEWWKGTGYAYGRETAREAWDAARGVTAWHTVERDGTPPCDGETVYVGINSAGFACCFNQARPDGLCLMGSPECSTAQMSELRWWRVLDRPDTSGVAGTSSPKPFAHCDCPDCDAAGVKGPDHG